MCLDFNRRFRACYFFLNTLKLVLSKKRFSNDDVQWLIARFDFSKAVFLDTIEQGRPDFLLAGQIQKLFFIVGRNF